MLQITNLTFQRDTSDNKSKELSSKLTTLQQSYYEVADAQKDLKVECDKYSSQLMAAKRNYKDLSGLYDEQNNHVNDQAQQYQASIRKLEEKIYQLSAENKKLNAEKAAQASTTQNKDEGQQHDSSKTLFRRPDRIIDHYSMLLDQSHEKNDTIQGLKASNAHLQKSLDRLQTEFTIKSTSYESLIESHEKLQQDYKDQAAQLKQSEKEIITLKDTLHSQKRDHDELSHTLKDREYQLQYVLKNTPYKALAPNSRPGLVTQLLSVTLQPASIPSIVEFKNIQEMQALNSRLISENHLLKTKINRTSNTTSHTTVPLEIASSSELPPAQTESTEKTSNEAVKTGLSDTSSQVVIDEFKVKVDKLTKDVKELQCELAFSQEEASTAKQETNKKSVTISQLENKCEALEQKAALLEQNLNLTTAERSRLKGVVDAAKEQENGVKKQLSALDSQSSRQLEEIGTLKQRLSQVQASYHRALEDLRSARNEVPELEAFIKRNTLLVKQKEKVDNKTVQDMREELQRAKTELSSTKKDLQIFLSRADNLKASANDGSQTKYMETLDNIVKLRVVTEKLDSQDKIIKELVTEKKSLMEKLDEAEETIKTNHLSRGQSTSSGTTTSVQSRLLADSQKRVVELEEKLTYYQQEIDRLKKEAQDAYKLNQENLQNNRDYVTKSIKNIDNQNEILKATQTKSQHSIDSFEITITASNGEIDKLKQENGTLSSQLLELKTENADLGSKLDNSKEEINMQAEKVVNLEENARIQEELLDDRQKEVQELQRVLQGLQTDLANAKGYEASAKEYAEEYKGTLQTSIERWNSTMDTLTAQYNTYSIESTKWSQKLQQVVQENFDKITQEVPPTGSQEAAAMIESLQRLNNALAGEKKDMEAMLASKLVLLETAQKELIAEKSELSSLVDKVAFLRDSNQALLTKAKPNDDLYQTELHAYSVQNEKLRSDKERLSAELADVTNQLNIKIPEVQTLEGKRHPMQCSRFIY
jgi:chromosome segregation ATPase